MILVKAEKIHELMTELYQVEDFVNDLIKLNVEPEIWLRAADGSVQGIASRKNGSEYQIDGLKECLRDFFEAKISDIKMQIDEM